jgi:hypothetical protein
MASPACRSRTTLTRAIIRRTPRDIINERLTVIPSACARPPMDCPWPRAGREMACGHRRGRVEAASGRWWHRAEEKCQGCVEHGPNGLQGARSRPAGQAGESTHVGIEASHSAMGRRWVVCTITTSESRRKQVPSKSLCFQL